MDIRQITIKKEPVIVISMHIDLHETQFKITT
jgi:hypothetical protein